MTRVMDGTILTSRSKVNVTQSRNAEKSIFVTVLLTGFHVSFSVGVMDLEPLKKDC